MREEVKPTILVADDNRITLVVLKELLEDEGYNVWTATNGLEALERVSENMPDLIISDIMMPEMDGFEVCERLKSDESTSFIPIVIVTVLDEKDERLRCVSLGADDFLIKPIDEVELTTRVKSLLKRKELHDELAQNYEQLQQLETYRDDLIHMIVHDMRSPLTAVTGYLQLLEMKIGSQPPDIEKDITQIQSSASILTRMVNDLLSITKIENEQLQLNQVGTDLKKLIEDAITLAKVTNLNEPSNISASLSEDLPLLYVDKDLIYRVVTNLVTNAIKYAPGDGKIVVKAKSDGQKVIVSVEDTGPGIPEEFQEMIFDKFGTVGANQEAQRVSTGLGLAFCKLAIEEHGGEIGVEGEVGEGSRFWFSLPLD